MKKKSNLNNAIKLSKLCINPTLHYLDQSQYGSFIGVRQPFFSLLNVENFKYLLKTSLLLLESLLKSDNQLIIITKINDPVLFLKFYQVCKKKKNFLLKDSEVFAGFLTNNFVSKKVILTLFLDATKMEIIQKECIRINCPLISFGGLSSNKMSSSLFVSGNYNSFIAQNFILSLLSISLNVNHNISVKKIKK